MIPANYLIAQQMLRTIAFFGMVGGVCFCFWCVMRIALMIDRRYPKATTVIHPHYHVEHKRYPMIQGSEYEEDHADPTL